MKPRAYGLAVPLGAGLTAGTALAAASSEDLNVTNKTDHSVAVLPLQTDSPDLDLDAGV